jgi:DNA-binding MarR family transcriptional regulator
MPSAIRRDVASQAVSNEVALDLETRATENDHQALRLWLRLLSCIARVESHVRGRLRHDFETTLPRFDLMAQLERCPDGLRMSELSKRLMVSGGNITGITDQLEREGLAVRSFDPADRRTVSVKLTKKGTERFRKMAARHERWIVDLFGGLTPEENLTMFGLLQKLKNHLGNLGTPSIAEEMDSLDWRRR